MRIDPNRASHFYLLVTLGFWPQIFLMWCWSNESDNAFEPLALFCPALITGCWNQINTLSLWDDEVHHKFGRIALFWFLPPMVGVLAYVFASTLVAWWTMLILGYLAIMVGWRSHTDIWGNSQA